MTRLTGETRVIIPVITQETHPGNVSKQKKQVNMAKDSEECVSGDMVVFWT